MTLTTQFPEVEEINRTDFDSTTLEKLLSNYGERIGSFQSDVGFHYGIYLEDLKCHPLVKKLSFLHIVGGPRKNGYIRYSVASFILNKAGHISFTSILYAFYGHKEPSSISLSSLTKMIELAHEHLK